MKEKLVILFVLLIHNVSGQNLTDSLIVRYLFNNGLATDLSQNELNATVMGATPVEDRFGNTNSALYFDGFNDFIQLPSSSLLKPDFPITYSFWVKIESYNQLENPFVNNDFQYNNYAGFWVNTSGDNQGKISASFGGNTGGIGPSHRRTKVSDIALSINVWHHIVVIYRSAFDIDIFIDCNNAGGAYSGSGSTSVEYSLTTGRLGSHPGNYLHDEAYFKGSFDDFSFWNKDLTYEELQVLCEEQNTNIEFVAENLCYGDITKFEITNIYNIDSVLWDFGDQNQSSILSPEHVFNQPGTYEIFLKCYKQGNILTKAHIINIETLPVFDLGQDIYMCKFKEADIFPDTNYNDYNYLWSNNSSTTEITVNKPGNYWLKITSPNGCSYADSIDVYNYTTPDVNLGTDTTINIRTDINLDAGFFGFKTTYLWDDYSTNRYRLVNGNELLEGQNLFFVSVTDSNFCVSSDTIIITFQKLNYDKSCGCVYFPNPSHDNIKIQNLENRAKKIELYSSSGKLLLVDDFKSEFYKINSSHLEEAIYYIIISKDETIDCRFKVLIKK